MDSRCDLGAAAGDARQMARHLARHCARFKGADLKRSLTQILTTAAPFLLLSAAMWFALEKGYWFALVLTLPAAGLMLRFFIIQHDCGHGSFFRSRFANDMLGRAVSLADGEAGTVEDEKCEAYGDTPSEEDCNTASAFEALGNKDDQNDQKKGGQAGSQFLIEPGLVNEGWEEPVGAVADKGEKAH